MAFQEGPPVVRYETLEEVDERLAANAAYGKDEHAPWYRRPVPVGWLLALVIVGVLAVLFSIGLTLHEAYEAQEAMDMAGSAPPFNGFFEWVHTVLAAPSPEKYMW